MFNKVVIAGVGLIGGSLGMALIKRNLARRIIGVDPDKANVEMAVQLGAVHQEATLAEALPDADMLILATPIGVTLGVLEMALPYLTPGIAITDVGSVKGRLVERAEAMLPKGINFVGGHPMAGLEVAGVAGAREDLFEGASYILTPTKNTDSNTLDSLRKLVLAIGAIPVELEHYAHDAAVAVISHLPHLLAATLVNTVAAEPAKEAILKLAGGGFRDTTRIAASNAIMWRDILLTNREMVLQAMQKFQGQLAKLEQSILNFDQDALVRHLEDSKKIRESLPENRKYVLAAKK